MSNSVNVSGANPTAIVRVWYGWRPVATAVMTVVPSASWVWVIDAHGSVVSCAPW